VADLATGVAAVARRAGAGSAGHRRPVAPRSVRSPLVAPRATSWTTTHRFAVSRSHWALGLGESAVGRAANSRRTDQTRRPRLREHRVALPARTAEQTVTDLAHISCESPEPVRMRHPNAVTGAPHSRNSVTQPQARDCRDRRGLKSLGASPILSPWVHSKAIEAQRHGQQSPALWRVVQLAPIERHRHRCARARSW